VNAALEVVVVPVADVDRAREFYERRLGFEVDHDTTTPGGERLVQLTPPGSSCSITVGTVGPSSRPVGMAPGSLRGLQLVVADLRAAHATLVERGVATDGIEVYDRGGLRPYQDGDPLDNVGFLAFDDPDGNGWVVQQISAGHQH
jgi:catechol 2,3-dioxygenase-like lactoylglutathione lyase family enzyme